MRPVAAITCLLLTVCLASASTAEVWSGTLADQVISFDDNEYARAVQAFAIREEAGTVHAVWGEDAPSVREIHYARTTDYGVTWTSATADRVISFPDGLGVNPEQCAIAGHSPGVLVVVWSEDVVDTREVHYGVSADGGMSWSSETQDLVLSDTSSAVDTGAPTIVSDADNLFHVVWTQLSPAGTSEVHYARSTDDGATWSGPSADRMISFPDGGNAVSPQIVAAFDRVLLVAWREVGDSGLPALHMGRSTDGGVTWSSETADREISQPANIITNLAADSEPCSVYGTHVVYTASFDIQAPFHYEVYATSSYDGGSTWTGESALTSISHDEGGGRSASNPDVFVAIGHGAIAVWDEEDEAAGTNEPHISYGPSWTGAAADEIVSFPDGEDGYRPSITGYKCSATVPGGARDMGDDAFILWTEFAGGATDNYEVHLSSTQRATNDVAEQADARRLELRVRPNPAGERIILIEWANHTPEPVTGVEIFDPAGRRVRLLDATEAGAVWDRHDDAGRRVAAGCYLMRARTARGIGPARLVVLL